MTTNIENPTMDEIAAEMLKAAEIGQRNKLAMNAPPMPEWMLPTPSTIWLADDEQRAKHAGMLCSADAAWRYQWADAMILEGKCTPGEASK